MSLPTNEADGAGRFRPWRRHRPGRGERLVFGLSALIRWWALLGGFLMAGLAVMTALSAISNILFAAPFPADYELVKHIVAIAIFMFLPYCQLAGANVTVDIFTEGMSEGKKAAMALFAAIFAIAFSAVLLRQMSLGWMSYLRYPEVTPVLKLPLWTAFPPILLSLVLLLLAAVLTAIDGLRVMAGRPSLVERPAMTIAE
ncbi:TRAP transporter small permease [Aurantimonas sp. VKM B-3413]|uniref:TRAP transporter small permease n=1 Tax=Aurantimonas sp. VKM B-3413 TaxID=2779401 RepID=UPI001E36FAC7|nr:TRAP transporter small permease subunit [Aurantimonas sp. VKM B-3413]MCB8838991.1 TRAP transporter small permease [Aurantimonas sp. VKM B-3413]